MCNRGWRIYHARCSHLCLSWYKYGELKPRAPHKMHEFPARIALRAMCLRLAAGLMLFCLGRRGSPSSPPPVVNRCDPCDEASRAHLFSFADILDPRSDLGVGFASIFAMCASAYEKLVVVLDMLKSFVVPGLDWTRGFLCALDAACVATAFDVITMMVLLFSVYTTYESWIFSRPRPGWETGHRVRYFVIVPGVQGFLAGVGTEAAMAA